MAGTFCLSGAVLTKAGTNVSANFKAGNAETNIVPLINQAEAYINVLSHYNWIDNYSSKNADVKLILEEAASNLAAIYAIQYDMSGYTSRIEAEDMINILYRRFKDCINILKEQANQVYMQGA